MPTDPEVNAELLSILGRQMLAEAKAAEAEGKPLDPRRIKNIMSYLELVEPRTFAPKQPEPVVNPETGEVVPRAPLGSYENPYPDQKFMSPEKEAKLAAWSKENYKPTEDDARGNR